MNDTNKKSFQLMAIVLVGFTVWIWHGIFSLSEATDAVYFLDVGQGDSQMILLNSPGMLSQVKIVIDGGRDKKVLTSLDQALGKNNNKYIDVLIATHSDLDHFGGLVEVLRRYKVGLFISNGSRSESEAFKALELELSGRQVPTLVLAEGDVIRYGNIRLAIISPDKELLADEDGNEASLVAVLEAQKSRILFTGDIGIDAENMLISKGYNLKADVLKIGHHGSNTSSGENFVAAVAPAVSVIGVGKNNYGHPSPRVLKILELSGSKIYRTDQDGTLKILLDK